MLPVYFRWGSVDLVRCTVEFSNYTECITVVRVYLSLSSGLVSLLEQFQLWKYLFCIMIYFSRGILKVFWCLFPSLIEYNPSL